MSKTEINDYLSKYDEDLANNVMYRVYGMPGPIFMEENNDTPPTPEPGPEPSPVYSIPFYVENITDEAETLTIAGYDYTEQDNYLKFPVEYSTDGTGWTSLGTTGKTQLTLPLQPGDKVYLRATTNSWYENDEVEHSCNITGVSKVGGNIMSLFYGSNFNGKETTFPSGTSYNFRGLFMIESDYNINLVNASELILPATTLTEGCYYNMFYYCTSLTTAPSLPATTLAPNCYSSMFQGCTELTTAPSLPATTLTEGCYDRMFNSCESLTTTPTLPATTLAEGCYRYMFGGCTSLTTAPTLPATTLTDECYNGMFYGCTNLNYIKCLATYKDAVNCTQNWVKGVAATGTFVKNPSMSGWTTSVSGIPSDWTVEDAQD